METRRRICLHYIIPKIGAGPIRTVIRVSRAIVGRYTTTRRPSSRARVHRPRLHSKYINEFTICALIPNGPTNRSSSRNALSFRAFALVRRYDGFLDANAGDREITVGEISRWELIAKSDVSMLEPVSLLNANKHFVRRSDVENSNWSRETRVRFNLDGFRRYRRYFKCKLIDLSVLPASPPPSRQSCVSDMNLPHRYFSQRKQKHGKLYALIRLYLRDRKKNEIFLLQI